MISRTNESGVNVNIDYDVLLNQTDQQYQAVNFTEEPDHSLGIIFSAVSWLVAKAAVLKSSRSFCLDIYQKSMSNFSDRINKNKKSVIWNYT